MIPKFEAAQNESDLELLMLELATKTCDSHSMLRNATTDAFFGRKSIAAALKIIDDKAVITALHDIEKARKDDLQIGDAIESVNGKSISQILSERERYLPSSNQSVKKRHNYAFLNGSSDSVQITFSRNGKTSQKTVKRYLSSQFQIPAKTEKKWEILDRNIGYINMGAIEIEDVNDVWKSLKKTKAIILDIRNYPKALLFPLASKLTAIHEFVTFTQPDADYPGKFSWAGTHYAGNGSKPEFKGKVILLVNETTQSRAEFTAMMFQNSPNTITVGSQTAGADGNVSDIMFPDCTSAYITGLGIFYPDGTQTQRTGVKIDFEIKPTIDGIASGKDEVLEMALKIASENADFPTKSRNQH